MLVDVSRSELLKTGTHVGSACPWSVGIKPTGDGIRSCFKNRFVLSLLLDAGWLPPQTNLADTASLVGWLRSWWVLPHPSL
jgi:hypothetical protein